MQSASHDRAFAVLASCTFAMKEALAPGTLVSVKVANESAKGQLTNQLPIIASVTVGSAIVITSALTSCDDRLIAWKGGQPPCVLHVCGVPPGSQVATQVLFARDAVMSNTSTFLQRRWGATGSATSSPSATRRSLSRRAANCLQIGRFYWASRPGSSRTSERS